MLNVVEEEEVRQFSLFSMYFIYYLVVQYCPYLRYHCVSKKKHKDLFETKLKKCAYLKPISSHFFANYMIVFHKTEVQKIILRCLMGLNSNWFNSYDTKHKYFHFRFFAILYKNTHLRFLCFCVLCHNFCTN